MTPASCLVLLLCAALQTHSFAHGTTILPEPCLSTGAPASMTRGVGGAARFQASRRTPHRAQVPSFTMPSDEFTVEAWVRREGSKRRRAETWLSFGTAQRARGLQVGFDENDVPRVSFWGDTLETRVFRHPAFGDGPADVDVLNVPPTAQEDDVLRSKRVDFSQEDISRQGEVFYGLPVDFYGASPSLVLQGLPETRTQLQSQRVVGAEKLHATAVPRKPSPNLFYGLGNGNTDDASYFAQTAPLLQSSAHGYHHHSHHSHHRLRPTPLPAVFYGLVSKPAPPPTPPPQAPHPKQGTLRLVAVDGSDTKGMAAEGYLEMYVAESAKSPFAGWGAVCDDHFDTLDAVVACRQLGFGAGVQAVPSPLPATPPPTSFFALDDLACRGSEHALLDCARTSTGAYGIGFADCVNATERVYVRCLTPPPSVVPPRAKHRDSFETLFYGLQGLETNLPSTLVDDASFAFYGIALGLTSPPSPTTSPPPSLEPTMLRKHAPYALWNKERSSGLRTTYCRRDDLEVDAFPHDALQWRHWSISYAAGVLHVYRDGVEVRSSGARTSGTTDERSVEEAYEHEGRAVGESECIADLPLAALFAGRHAPPSDLVLGQGFNGDAFTGSLEEVRIWRARLSRPTIAFFRNVGYPSVPYHHPYMRWAWLYVNFDDVANARPNAWRNVSVASLAPIRSLASDIEELPSWRLSWMRSHDMDQVDVERANSEQHSWNVHVAGAENFAEVPFVDEGLCVNMIPTPREAMPNAPEDLVVEDGGVVNNTVALGIFEQDLQTMLEVESCGSILPENYLPFSLGTDRSACPAHFADSRETMRAYTTPRLVSFAATAPSQATQPNDVASTFYGLPATDVFYGFRGL